MQLLNRWFFRVVDAVWWLALVLLLSNPAYASLPDLAENVDSLETLRAQLWDQEPVQYAQASTGIANDGTAPTVLNQGPKTSLMVVPSGVTTLEEGKVARIGLRLVEAKNLPAGSAIPPEVRFEAAVRYFTIDGRQIGQVLITKAMKDSKAMPLEAANFAGQFSLENGQLGPGQQLETVGDGQMLMSVLQENPNNALPAVPAQAGGGESQGASSTPVAGGGSSNELARNYQTPTPEAKKADEKAKESVRVTTEGCTIRVDKSAKKAVQQSRTETVENGAVKSRGTCSDGGTSYPIVKSYLSCPDKVDVGGLKANPQYQEYYEKDGSRVTVTDCTPDTDQTFTIKEVFTDCKVNVDVAGRTATPFARLVYTNKNNREVQARGCQKSVTKKAAVMTQVVGACGVRHDLAGGKSYQLARWTYVLDGLTYQATDCVNGTTTFAHSQVTKESNGNYLCKPVVSGGSYRLQSRTAVTIGGEVKYISECKVVASGAATALLKSFNNCPDKVDIGGLKANRQYQEYYPDGNGQSVVVSECKPDTATYTISEKYGGCEVVADVAKGTATPQASLVYTNGNGNEVQVRGCAPSKVKVAVKLAQVAGSCPVRHDMARSLSVQTATWTYTLDGKVVQVGGCVDSPTTYAHTKVSKEANGNYVCQPVVNKTTGEVSFQSRVRIKVGDQERYISECALDSSIAKQAMTKAYANCPDKVDIAGLKANPQYQDRYKDGNGQDVMVSECKPDTAQVLTITEKFDGCKVTVDVTKGTATPQAALVYTNANGNEVLARGCEAAKTKAAVKLTQVAGSCPVRHDMARSLSVQTATWVYTLDGKVVQVGGCVDSPTTYAHTKVSKEANGNYVCQPVVNKATGEVSFQSRVRIKVGDQERYISECALDTSIAKQAMTKAYANCLDKVDIAGLKAWPQYQDRYKDGNGQDVMVSACKPDTTKVFIITEKFGGCKVVADVAKGTATPQAALVYTNANGNEVLARGCEAAKTKAAVKLTQVAGSCPVRHDMAKGLSVQTATWTYTIDGKVVQVGGCVDSPTTYAHTKISKEANGNYVCQPVVNKTEVSFQSRVRIRVGDQERYISECALDSSIAKQKVAKSYAACPDKIDVGQLKAWPQYQNSYLDGRGQSVIVSDCQPDTTQVYTIIEKFTDCRVDVDIARVLATPQASLVYTNRAKSEVQVRGCAASTTKAAVKLVQVAGSCPIRHDTAKGTSIQTARWTYTLDGAVVQSSGCVDSPTTYTHTKVSKEGNGNYLCKPVVDKISGLVTLQSRLMIRVNGQDRYITECAVDPAIAKQKLSRSYTSCPDKIDAANLKAWPQYQEYYLDGTGQNVITSDCQPDTAQVLTITEKFEGCKVNVDVAAGTATPLSSLVYKDRAGREVQVRGCQGSSTQKAVGLKQVATGCPLRHDFSKGQSVQTATWSYTLNSLVHQATGCVDSPQVFAHKKVIKEANGNYVCAPGVDQTTGVVRLQYRLAITTGGQEQYITECATDTASQPVKLQKDYAACPDKTDLGKLKAWPQYQQFYLDGAGKKVIVSGCQSDATQTFAMMEKFEGCKVNVSVAGKLATPYASLVYTDRAGREVQVRDCGVSATRKAVPLVQSVGSCPIRHDVAKGRSVQTATWGYTLDGVVHQTPGCVDSPTVFVHKKVIKETNGNYVCAPVVDQATGVVRLQYRLAITTGGQDQYITECATDTASQPVKLQKDYAACPDKSDLAKLKAWPQYQQFYLDGTGKKVIVSGCQSDATQTFAMTEKFEGCKVNVDVANKLATPYASLVYTDRAGREVQVRDCGVSATKKAVPLVQSVGSCPIRHDVAKGRSVQTATWGYTLDGVVHQTPGCVDSPTVFAHKKVIKEANGNYVCAPVVDQGVVRLQARLAITANGQSQYVTECATDTASQPVKLQKDYAACPDKSDLAQLKAWPQYQQFYLDGTGKKVIVSGCQIDATQTFAMTEKFEGCKVNVDTTKKLATPYASLIYTDRAGREVQVRDCGVSATKKAVPLVQSVGSCPIQHDLAKGRSVQTATWGYTMDGVVHQTPGCVDSPTVFAHTKVSKDGAGNYICQPVVDLNKGTVQVQSRVSITVGGQKRYIAECAPDTAIKAAALQKDYAVCPDRVDVAQFKAWPQYQHYYTDGAGSKIIVSGCLTDTATTLAMTEKFTGCKVNVDKTKKLATPYASLVYKDKAKREVQVRGCTASITKKAVPLVQVAGTCPIRHDFGKGQSIQTAVWTYTLDGTVHQTPGCVDSPTVYPHKKLTQDGSGNYLCQPIVDQANRSVTIQYRTGIIVDGQAQYIANCAPDTAATTIKLKPSYVSCSDKMDFVKYTAHPQYQLYYVDAAQRKITVSDCMVDTATTYRMVEKHDACKVAIDYTKYLATPQSTLSYKNRDNIEVQARGCQASVTKKAVTLTSIVGNCTIRHDFSGGKSVQQVILSYTLEGTVYQLGGCKDGPTSYPHVKTTHATSGALLCTPIEDKTNLKVTLQYRMAITVNKVIQYVTACAPDAGSTLPIVSTTDGCTDPSLWSHDLKAGVSYGQHRYYYLKNGQREYLSPCQTSTATYIHQVTTVGWQNHDDQLSAFALTTVYIKLTSGGSYTVQTNAVLPGAVKQPYTLSKTEDVKNGLKEYAGCYATPKTAKTQFWQRPDKTIYQKVIGAGSPGAQYWACTQLQNPSWSLVASTLAGSGSGTITYYTQAYGSCEFGGDSSYQGSYQRSRQSSSYSATITGSYRGQRLLQREDGQQITQNSKNTYSTTVLTKSWSGGTNWQTNNHRCNDYRSNTSSQRVGISVSFSGTSYAISSGGGSGTVSSHHPSPPSSWNSAEGW